MKIKIRPRTDNDRGMYACMPMKKHISVGHSDWKLANCPECGEECWETPMLRIAQAIGAVGFVQNVH